MTCNWMDTRVRAVDGCGEAGMVSVNYPILNDFVNPLVNGHHSSTKDGSKYG